MARHTFGKANKRYFKLLLEAIENDSELGGDIQDDEEPAPVQDAGLNDEGKTRAEMSSMP